MTSIFVTVGTDHHPFDRLTGWIEWWSRQRGLDLTFLVQHGASLPVPGARNRVSLPLRELQEAHRHCDVVVGQVGPGTIADANAAGKRPLVVPRRAALGEVVDDHQVLYGQLMAQEERVHLAEDRGSFERILDELVADPALGRVDPSASDAAAVAAEEVMGVVHTLVADHHRLPRLPDVARRWVRLRRATR
ncbi:glycosyltransferase [Ornithinimicrobium sp. Y1847]|uniref:glycosyltransferase n=1 Tax=Ornithinimicrobium sp. Y1847 TaxID=3405419 RepID=UPI003B670D0C